jgi:tape measure domain-containing protein
MSQVERLLAPMRAFQSILGAIAAAAGVQRLIALADTWKLIEGRLKLVTSGTSELIAVQERLFGIAQRTRATYEGTAELYARVARANNMLGRSQEDLLRFTSLTQMAIQSSGAGAQEAAAGVIQLGQALASGQLRGDELRSVLENLNGVAIELAAGLGVSVGELRKLAEAGKLTSQSIVEALLSRGQQIEERFAALPVTVGQAFTALGNSFLRFIGETDASLGITAALSAGIMALADNMDLLAAGLAGASLGGNPERQPDAARDCRINGSARGDHRQRPDRAAGALLRRFRRRGVGAD